MKLILKNLEVYLVESKNSTIPYLIPQESPQNMMLRKGIACDC